MNGRRTVEGADPRPRPGATIATDGGGSIAFKAVLQVLAVFCALVIGSMILHKGYAGISALAQKFSGAEFWVALGRYLLQNLSG